MEDANKALPYVSYRQHGGAKTFPRPMVVAGKCELLGIEFSSSTERNSHLNRAKINQAIILARRGMLSDEQKALCKEAEKDV